MSSFTVFGFFCLRDSVRASTTNPLGATRYHNYYNTRIQIQDSSSYGHLDARFCVYSPTSANTPFPNDTVVFAYAKAYIPPQGTDPRLAFLEVFEVHAFGGVATDPNYQDPIPDLTHTIAVVVGTVQSSSGATEADPNKRATLLVSDRLWDQTRNSTIE